jgi:hypothetical protein
MIGYIVGLIVVIIAVSSGYDYVRARRRLRQDARRLAKACVDAELRRERRAYERVITGGKR